MQRSRIVGRDEHHADVVAVSVELPGDRIERGVDAAAPERLVDADRPTQRPALRGNRFPVDLDGVGEVEYRPDDGREVGGIAVRWIGDGDETGDFPVSGGRHVHTAGGDGRSEPDRGMQD